MIDKDTNRPIGWPADRSKEPEPQGPYYCSALSNIGHAIAEQHYLACLYAGVCISGFNAEVMLGQWEFQIGPCEGLDAGDHLLVARYILQRVCALHNCIPTLDPKPVAGDWNGSGLHTNFSTVEMRREPPVSQSNETSSQKKEREEKDKEKDSWRALISAVTKLQIRHREHMLVYGEGNDRRMTGDHETSGLDECTFGVGDRGASIRIGERTVRDGYGYLEDRRPASSANPYLVTAAIAETTLLL